MANIKLNGQDYYDVDKVVLPTVEGGTKEFSSGGGGGGSSELFETLVDRSIEGFEPTDMANISTIGRFAFANCQNITDVEIPSNITVIESEAFTGSSITTLRINEGCTQMAMAFPNCINLTTVYIPESMQFAADAFSGCNNLSDIYYNSTKADWQTLYNNGIIAALEQMITVHCTDGDIEYNAPVGNMVVTFSSTLHLEPLEVPVPAIITKNLASYVISHIGYGNLDKVRTVTFPEGVESICEYFAQSCTGLNGVTFPSTLRIIQASAFAGTKLTSIDLPASIETIGSDAFANLNISGGNVEVTCRALVPPYLDFGALDVGSNATLTNIYVPSASVTDYQQDTNWSQYASIISAIV